MYKGMNKLFEMMSKYQRFLICFVVCFVMLMEELRCDTELNCQANPTNSHGREKFYFLEIENNSRPQRLQINL